MGILHNDSIDVGLKSSSQTPTEELLTIRVGNLHDYIPRELNKPGITQAHVARTLGISAAWLSRWLSNNGYKRISRWEQCK